MEGEYKRKFEILFVRRSEEFEGEKRKTEKTGEKVMLSILAMDWHDLSRLAKKFKGSRQGGQKRPVLSDFRGADENFRGGGAMLFDEILRQKTTKSV